MESKKSKKKIKTGSELVRCVRMRTKREHTKQKQSGLSSLKDTKRIPLKCVVITKLMKLSCTQIDSMDCIKPIGARPFDTHQSDLATSSHRIAWKRARTCLAITQNAVTAKTNRKQRAVLLFGGRIT